jgi:hypothetical protein
LLSGQKEGKGGNGTRERKRERERERERELCVRSLGRHKTYYFAITPDKNKEKEGGGRGGRVREGRE